MKHLAGDSGEKSQPTGKKMCKNYAIYDFYGIRQFKVASMSTLLNL